MKKYPKYKPSNIQWIGDIPEHWELKKLKYIGESIIGITYSPDDVTTDENKVLVLRSSNIQNGRLAFDDCVYVTKEIQNKHFVKKDDVLLCARNGSAHLVGKCAIIGEKDLGASFGAFMSIFRSSSGKFIYYFFNSQVFKAQTGLFSTSTVNQLTSDTLNNMFAAMPSDKEEQSAIANYLDQKTSQLDTLITNKQKLIELLKEERTAIINEAVSLPADKLGSKGKNWVKKKLKYLAIVQSSNVDKKSNEDEISVLLCNYIDVYKNEFIVDGISFMKATAKESEIEKFILQEGDVLITKDSETPDDIAKPALVTKNFENVICGYHLAQIRANKTDLTGEFLFRLFQSKDFNCHFEVSANGVTRYGLPLASITDVYISFPSVKEQIEIVKHIHTENLRIENTVLKIEKEINLLQEYKVALISEVVTGKVKVI